MTVGVFTFVNSHLFQFIVARERRVFRQHLRVQMLQPLLLGTAFGKLLVDILAKPFCHFAEDPVDRFALEFSGGDRLNKDEIAHIAGVVVGNNVFLLDGHQVRQQDIGVFGRGGHKVFDNHDRLALAFVLQDLVGLIDIGVLVNDGIAGVVPDEFNRHVQLLFPSNAVAGGGHLRAAIDGVGPAKAGDGGFDRVGQYRQAFNGDGIGGFAGAAVAAVNADVAGQNRQHGDRPGGQLAVSLALRTPSLANVSRPGAADFPGQLDDAVDGNAGDPRGPLRRFRHAVIALSENIRFVMPVLRGICRQRFFIVADAVRIKERLIDQIFINQHPGDTRHQRGVGAGANRDPLILPPGGGVRVARVDNDHSRVRALSRLF